MIKKILMLAFFVFGAGLNAKCLEQVIYGNDNRQDIYQTTNPLFLNLAKSTAAMISTTALVLEGDSYIVKSGTLENDGICADEQFAKQPTAALCTGFLVGKDLMLTAGHCVETINDCESNFWVFDYANTISEQSVFSIPKENVYKCVSIVAQSLDASTQNDFALVKLDRVSERLPMNFRKNGQVDKCSELLIIGHPSGLPTKISTDAYIRKNSNKYYFTANIDSFGGNSGSPVIDRKTGIVEGILVRGERDYNQDPVKNCLRPKKCKMNECRGEDVTRITNIKEIQ